MRHSFDTFWNTAHDAHPYASIMGYMPVDLGLALCFHSSGGEEVDLTYTNYTCLLLSLYVSFLFLYPLFLTCVTCF